MDNNEIPLNIYLDLSKAFDTLDHNSLLDKLHYYGIRNTPLDLFKNYLTNREQYVEIDNFKLIKLQNKSQRIIIDASVGQR